jgi:hypothetical protein
MGFRPSLAERSERNGLQVLLKAQFPIGDSGVNHMTGDDCPSLWCTSRISDLNVLFCGKLYFSHEVCLRDRDHIPASPRTFSLERSSGSLV